MFCTHKEEQIVHGCVVGKIRSDKGVGYIFEEYQEYCFN